MLLIFCYSLDSSILDLFASIGACSASSSEMKTYKRQLQGRKSWVYSYSSTTLAFGIASPRFLSKCQGTETESLMFSVNSLSSDAKNIFVLDLNGESGAPDEVICKSTKIKFCWD